MDNDFTFLNRISNEMIADINVFGSLSIYRVFAKGNSTLIVLKYVNT